MFSFQTFTHVTLGLGVGQLFVWILAFSRFQHSTLYFYFFSEDFFDCVNSGGSIIESPSNEDTAATGWSTTTARTTSSLYQRPGSWQRTTSRPSASLTTNRYTRNAFSNPKSGHCKVIVNLPHCAALLSRLALTGQFFPNYRCQHISRVSESNTITFEGV